METDAIDPKEPLTQLHTPQSNTNINTAGGSSIRDIYTEGGNFVGRDQSVYIFVEKWNWNQVFEEYIANKIEDATNLIEKPWQAPNQTRVEFEKAAREQLQAQVQTRDKTEKLTREQWKAWNWALSAKAYGQSLFEQFSTIRILGKSEEVSLEGIFTDINIFNEITARLRYDIRELRNNKLDRFNQLSLYNERQQRVNGFELVKQGQNLFILGKPGAGKTTFLKYITLQAIQGKLGRTPIFISLYEWAQSGEKTFLSFIVRQFAMCNFPEAQPFIEQLLKGGKAVVLFDGLDEVKQDDDQRSKLVYLLNNFAKEYRRSQHLITCRIAASDYAFEGFSDVEVADFNQEQIKTYVKKWFDNDMLKYKALISELYTEDNAGILELCTNPLLLSMLCLAFNDNLEFPTRRIDLYIDALDALLRKWDSTRNIKRDEIYRNLSRQRKEQLFANIAAPTFELGEYFIDQRRLEKLIVTYLTKLPNAPAPVDIDGTAILKAIEAQHSIFVERAQGIYSFSHLSFQEYFTAKYIVDNEARGTTWRLILNHITDNRWREVFQLTVSQLDDANSFIKEMRIAIENLVYNDVMLNPLLVWANNKANVIDAKGMSRAIIRLSYIVFSALMPALVRDLDLAPSGSSDLFINLNLASQLTRTRIRDFDLMKDVANNFAFISEINLAKAQNLVITLITTYGLDLGLDFGLLYAWQIASMFSLVHNIKYISEHIPDYLHYFALLIKLSQEAGESELTLALTNLDTPSENSQQEQWSVFANKLSVLTKNYRNIRYEWQLDVKRIEKLQSYFIANGLLVQCMNLSAISNRQLIEESLLIPTNTEE